MNIRFACEHCGQKLSVPPDKAGRKARCPKCKESFRIPSAQEATTALAEAGITEDEVNPYAQFEVFDTAPDVIYETETAIPREGGAFDPTKVAVSRGVIYAQGVLLVAVAIGAFILGQLWSGQASPPSPTNAKSDQPPRITGRVTAPDLEGDPVPDEGAVVIVLPESARPETKVKSLGLAPTDPPPLKGHTGVEAIEAIGGRYVRTNENGRFDIALESPQTYYILVISKRARPKSSDPPDNDDLADMGEYFLNPHELVEGRRYNWQKLQVSGPTPIEAPF